MKYRFFRTWLLIPLLMLASHQALAASAHLDAVKYLIEPPIQPGTQLRIELIITGKASDSGGYSDYSFGGSSGGSTEINCGLEIDWGDGNKTDARIGSVEKPPYLFEHRYQNRGNYVLNIQGKTIVRGLNTAFACDAEHVKPILVQ